MPYATFTWDLTDLGRHSISYQTPYSMTPGSQPGSTMAFNLLTLVKGYVFDAVNFADFSEWMYISLIN